MDAPSSTCSVLASSVPDEKAASPAPKLRQSPFCMPIGGPVPLPVDSSAPAGAFAGPTPPRAFAPTTRRCFSIRASPVSRCLRDVQVSGLSLLSRAPPRLSLHRVADDPPQSQRRGPHQDQQRQRKPLRAGHPDARLHRPLRSGENGIEPLPRASMAIAGIPHGLVLRSSRRQGRPLRLLGAQAALEEG
jgi:hypothetical protein